MVEVITHKGPVPSTSQYAALLTLRDDQALLVDNNTNTHTAVRMFARNKGLKVSIRPYPENATKSIVKIRHTKKE